MSGEVQDPSWPLPKFYFQVQIGGQTLAFQEVSGLESKTQVLDYRAGDSSIHSPVKMPGMVQTGHVTLKKGVFVNDNRFWDWYNRIKLNTIARETVVIQLLYQEGDPTMTWTLNNAWPTKVTGTDLKADGNEVAVETVELAHEGLTIQNG